MRSFQITALSVLFFFASQIAGAQEIRLVKDLSPGDQSSFTNNLEEIIGTIDQQILFLYIDADDDINLYISDGTEAGTNSIFKVESSSNFDDFIPYQDKYLFRLVGSAEDQLWITDGTTAGTLMLVSRPNAMRHITLLGDQIYFSTDEDFDGDFLWKYDLISSDFSQFFTFPWPKGVIDMSAMTDDQLIIMGSTEDGRELYTSDGTTAGTQNFYTLNNGSEFSQKTYLTRVGNRAFFFYKFPNDLGGKYTLFVTDGTTSGTQGLQDFDISTFSNWDQTRSMMDYNGLFLFKAETLDTPSNRARLYVSDGTVNGTKLLDPVADEPLRHSNMTLYKDEVYFVGDFGGFVYGVFKTDGTPEGTIQLITGSGLGGGASFGGWDMQVFQDSLYFSAWRSQTGNEMWVSGGTTETTRVIEMIDGSEGSSASDFMPTDELLFFFAETPETGKELFVYVGGPSCGPGVSNIETTLCEGESVVIEGMVFDETGMYEIPVETGTDCDSVVFLDLTIELPIPVDLGADTSLFLGQELTVEVEAGTADVIWPDGSTGDSYVFVADDFGLGTFTIMVIVTTANGCQSMDEISITVQEIVSVKNIAVLEKYGISLKPNPVLANAAITISMDNWQELLVAVHVQDLAGKSIQKRRSFTGIDGQNFALEGLAEPGLYMIQLVLGSGEIGGLWVLVN